MASRRDAQSGSEARDRWRRWRRWIITGQGTYYVLTGLWPVVHFSSFARFVAVNINAFQAHAFAAVIVVVGASLIQSARREPPGPFPASLGIAVAAAITLVDLIWLPRFGVASALWLDAVVEVAFVVGLLLSYPWHQPEPARTGRRR